MTFSPDTIAALGEKLDKANVKERTQANRTLSYIEGWHAIAEANRIFGFDGWNRETIRLEETNRELLTLKGDRGDYQQWRVGYLAVVKIVVGDVVRHGTGFGSGSGRPEALGDTIESAVKEAETDAMKRALMTFGWPFGLALYDKSQEHVEKAEPAPKAATPAPSRPAPTPAPPSAAAFWSRASYEITGKANVQAFGESFCKACEQAPSTDALLKLDDDNKAHLEALRGADAPAYQKTRIAVSAAHSKFPKKAA